jgi:hypothetical protein
MTKKLWCEASTMMEIAVKLLNKKPRKRKQQLLEDDQGEQKE